MNSKLAASFASIARRIAWTLKKPCFIVLVGPPGAGKGTLANELAAYLSIVNVSMGDLFRREKAEGTEIGKQIADVMTTGKLAPDSLTIRVLQSELTKFKYFGGAILDGFPRNSAQAELLFNLLANQGAGLNSVILLDVPESDLVERLVHRLTCSNKECGRTFHLKMLPPLEPGVCDHCKSSLYQRADDSKDVIESRLATYRTETAPLIAFYRAKKLLLTVAAGNDVSKEKVLEIVTDALF